MPGTLAITGGTGFVGKSLIATACERGWKVRALTRRLQQESAGVTWISGALDQQASLSELVSGSDAVIHVAGVTNTPTRDGFFAGNVLGTQAVIDATRGQGVRRFVHVSSLTAREPQLSNYGWSKAEAECRVVDSGLDWTMVRPPAIYGPGDSDHLELFKAAKWGVIPLPPKGRMSEIEVSDLARLLVALAAETGSYRKIYEVDDERELGWTHEEFAHAIGGAVGRRVLALHLPAALVHFAAHADRLMRGDNAKLTADRAAYFCHSDWVIDPAKRPPPDLWRPQIEAHAGLAATARAYRDAGLL